MIGIIIIIIFLIFTVGYIVGFDVAKNGFEKKE